MNNQRLKILIGLSVLFFLVLSACSLADILANVIGDQSQEVEEKVMATLSVLQTEMASPVEEVPTATATDLPDAYGTITGYLSYPSEFLPPQRVVAFDVNDLDNYFMTEIQSGNVYALEVPVGTYYVLAYLMDPSLVMVGGYSEAVPCGLQVGCDDHSLIPVEVSPGQTVTNIDPADWYIPVEQITDWPGDPTLGETGVITGELGYPSSFIPPQRVVAFNIQTGDYYDVNTDLDQATYQILGLPPGVYHVVAYVQEMGAEIAGGYSYFVLCGMTQDCDDHQLVDVIVNAGEVVEGVDPIDFYMQPGEADWPEEPDG